MTAQPHLALSERRRAPVRLMNWLLVAALATLVAACGGGGGGGAAAGASADAGGGEGATFSCTPPPEGVQPYAATQAAVGGAIVGRADPSFIMLQTPDDIGRGFDRVLIYGPNLAAAPAISGVIYAAGGAGGCSSPDTTAYNGLESAAGVSSRAYLRTGIGDNGGVSTLLDGGSLRYPTATYALAPGPLPGMAAGHALAPALLANAVGPWALKDRADVGMSLDVAADGALTLRYRGCTLNGNLQVADGGLYKVTARHEATSCTSSWAHDMTYDGLALAYPLATGSWQMVVSLTVNNGFDFDDMLAIGRR
jgi:hypothetical protein